MRTIFIDSSVLFSASKSRTGASTLLMAYCRKGIIQGYVSIYVIAEVKKNISKETDQKVKQRLNSVLNQSKLKIVNPTQEEIKISSTLIKEKDAPILSAALKSRVDYLITLDRKDFMRPKLRKAVKPMEILTPKDLVILFSSLP